MRGLLFTGGEMPDMAVASLFFGDYAFSVAADSGLEAALRAGVVPDLVIGDMDSVRSRELLDALPPDRVERWDVDKDYTDTELALSALEKRGVDEVILLGGSGGRLDHLFAIEELFKRKYCPELWISGETIVVVVEGGARRSCVEIVGLSGLMPLSVFPVLTGTRALAGTRERAWDGDAKRACRGEGLHWSIDGLDWDAGSFSLSNRADAPRVRIFAESGRFLVVVPASGELKISYR